MNLLSSSLMMIKVLLILVPRSSHDPPAPTPATGSSKGPRSHRFMVCRGPSSEAAALLRRLRALGARYSAMLSISFVPSVWLSDQRRLCVRGSGMPVPPLGTARKHQQTGDYLFYL
jgi:hypothetical protein